MSATITKSELQTQAANFAPVVAEVRWRVVHAKYAGAFDDDPKAQERADALSVDASEFYDELLMTCPKPTTPQPAAEVHSCP